MFIDPWAGSSICHFEPKPVFSRPPGDLQCAFLSVPFEMPMNTSRVADQSTFQYASQIMGRANLLNHPADSFSLHALRDLKLDFNHIESRNLRMELRFPKHDH